MRQPFFEVKSKCFQYLHLNNTKQITQSNLSERSSKVNALQSQKNNQAEHTQTWSKWGKQCKIKPQNIGPKRSKDPKYLNVIIERAAPNGKVQRAKKREKGRGTVKGFLNRPFIINFVDVLFLSYIRPESKR